MKSAKVWRKIELQEIEFRNWLISTGYKAKIVSDTISRLKRLEHELDNCDIDEEYHRDKCHYLLSLFVKMGKNDAMAKYHNTNLPIGKYYMNTYRYALRKYILFSDILKSDN